MSNAQNQIESEIIATRQTADGVTVHLHADGNFSNRLNFYRVKCADRVKAFRIMADICLHDASEISALIKKGRK